MPVAPLRTANRWSVSVAVLLGSVQMSGDVSCSCWRKLYMCERILGSRRARWLWGSLRPYESVHRS